MHNFTSRLVILGIVFLFISFTAQAQRPFITTWKTDNPGTSNDYQITIPTNPSETYNYDIDWGDGTNDTGITGNITHSYSSPGVYTISINGNFPQIFFNNELDKSKILTVEQWGDITWRNMANAFHGCNNFIVNADDSPILTNVTDMSAMFKNANISIANNINNWDVSNITNMSFTFSGSSFNGSLNNWIVNMVTDMSYMFHSAVLFNNDINSWNVDNVTNMSHMFHDARSFNRNIVSWSVKNVTDMSYMFNQAYWFNQDITSWDVNNVSNMSHMFDNARRFNRNLGNWNTSNVTNMSSMFRYAFDFNQDINSWDVGNVVNMSAMFDDARVFNQDIGNWNTSKVTDMSRMFRYASNFNQDIGSWNLSNVSDMTAMFQEAISFNQDLNLWDVSNVSSMELMFLRNSSFNGNISNWDVTNVLSMRGMFEQATAFNCNIGGWNISNIDDLTRMFSEAASFDQNLGNWDISNINDFYGFLSSSGLSPINYNSTLTGWLNLPSLQPNINFYADGLYYQCSENAKQEIINTYNWNFIDEGESFDCLVPFVTIWKTDNPGYSNDNQIKISTHWTADENKFDIYWENINDPNINGEERNLGWGLTLTFPIPGTYRIEIRGNFRSIYFNSGNDPLKILSIEQWGDIEWSTMQNAFSGCQNLIYNAMDTPDLSNVTNMSSMFASAYSFNGDISNWDVSNVSNMQSMFHMAFVFDQDIGSWDVSNVTNMGSMFYSSLFNQNISNWDVSNVTNMSWMFKNAHRFDQNLGSWGIGNVADMHDFLSGSNMSVANYDNTLNGWGILGTMQNNVQFGAVGAQYCDGEEARNRLINEFGWNITDDGKASPCCPEPNSNSTNLTFSNVSHSNATLNWQSGSGNKRLIIARANSNVNAIPADGIEYTASSHFGSGHNFGNGNFAVYSGSGNSVSLSGLSPTTTYYFKVYEFNQETGCVTYLLNNPPVGNITTSCYVSQPTTNSSNLSYSDVRDTRMNLSWTKGNGNLRMVVAKKGGAVDRQPSDGNWYSHSTTFGNGANLGNGNYVVYKGSGSSFTLSGLQASSTYHFAIFEYNQNTGCYVKRNYKTDAYLTGSKATKCSAPAQPTNPGSGLTWHSKFVTDSFLSFGWTKGNGSKTIVIARKNYAVNRNPIDGTIYTANASFGNGSHLGYGNYVVYIGTESFLKLSGLQASSTYHIAVYEYNQNNNCYTRTNYLTSSKLTSSGTTKCSTFEPTAAPSSLSFYSVTSSSMGLSFSPGNGERRIVIARKNYSVNKNPIDNNYYSASSTFGSGAHLGDGNYVIYSGTGSSATVYGLEPSTTYNFKVIEYNAAFKGVCYPSYNYMTTGRTGSRTTTSTPPPDDDPCIRCPIQRIASSEGEEEIPIDFQGKQYLIGAANTTITIIFSTREIANSQINVYDLGGRLVTSVDNTIDNDLYKTITLSQAAGENLYLVQITNTNGTETTRVFVGNP